MVADFVTLSLITAGAVRGQTDMPSGDRSVVVDRRHAGTGWVLLQRLRHRYRLRTSLCEETGMICRPPCGVDPSPSLASRRLVLTTGA